jgi:hypothetical protein
MVYVGISRNNGVDGVCFNQENRFPIFSLNRFNTLKKAAIDKDFAL